MSALRGLAAAMLPPEAGGPEPAVLEADLRAFLGHLSSPARLGLRLGAGALAGAGWVALGSRLEDAPVERRDALLARLARVPALDDALTGLKASVALVAGATAFRDAMHAKAAEAPPARPDASLDVTPADGVPSRFRCDVVVVGSGAGGAVAAQVLAESGLAVVVVEEGRRWSVDEFRTGDPAERFGRLYRDGGATVALGRPPVVLPIGTGVGGSTLVNSGTCFRTPIEVLTHWRDDGLALADPDTFGPHLDAVEAMLGVAPVPAAVMGRNGEQLLAGAAALGWDAGPLLRNAPGCGGSCQCAIGCPRNAKFGVHLNALPAACAAGARIVSELRVDRVTTHGGRAVGVRGRRRGGSRVEIVADHGVVVACGATETPGLLRRSGVGRHPRLGRNLALHPALSAAGRFDEPIVPWDGVLQSATVEEFRASDGILIEATSTPPGMGSMALPGYGSSLVREIDTADHLVTLGAMIGDAGSGRVLGRHRRATVLRYDLTPADGRRLLLALARMGEALFAAGARSVLTGIGARPEVTTAAELDDVVRSTNPARLHLAAFHPTGTAAAGGDPQRHPVDPDGRLRGVERLWVTDASAVPTCPEVNPQVTIMALARAVATGVTT